MSDVGEVRQWEWVSGQGVHPPIEARLHTLSNMHEAARMNAGAHVWVPEGSELEETWRGSCMEHGWCLSDLEDIELTYEELASLADTAGDAALYWADPEAEW